MNPFYSYFLAAIYALLGAEYWWVGLVLSIQLGIGVRISASGNFHRNDAICYLIYAFSLLGRKLWSLAQIGLLAAWHGGHIYQPYVKTDSTTGRC